MSMWPLVYSKEVRSISDRSERWWPGASSGGQVVARCRAWFWVLGWGMKSGSCMSVQIAEFGSEVWGFTP